MNKLKLCIFSFFCIANCEITCGQSTNLYMNDEQFSAVLSQNNPILFQLSNEQYNALLQSRIADNITGESAEQSLMKSINIDAIRATVPQVIISALVNKTIFKNSNDSIGAAAVSASLPYIIIGLFNRAFNKYKPLFQPGTDMLKKSVSNLKIKFQKFRA